MKFLIYLCVFVLFLNQLSGAEEKMNKTSKWSVQAQIVLDVTKPLKFDRGKRLPLFTKPTSDPGELDEADAELLVRELNRRGIGVICSWSPGKHEESLSRGLPVARAQKKLGILINTNATSCMYSFFNGDKRTAHIDDRGQPFFDTISTRSSTSRSTVLYLWFLM